MRRVFIAEKPSLARAIAAVLPRPHRNFDGYIETGEGDIVTWCIGHLLEQVPPDAYDPRYKRWSLSDLPIVPSKWRLAPRSSGKKQLAVLRTLLKSSPPLVHAGDPDREGQLLVDEVIDYLGYPAGKRSCIARLLISDLNPAAVSRALQSMGNNRDYAPLSVSALARSRADWLYGMNMSRAYTLLGQKAGYQGVLSVGRVQTPVLGLVVRRDDEIAAFVSKPYYQVDARIPHEGSDILARWQPSKACRPYQDEEGRILHKALAENVVARIKDQPATVTQSEHKDNRQDAPLPYSLSALQIDAARRYGMTAANVLAACQSLYEQHKLITYPRSDCRYLPTEHHAQASSVFSAITSNAATLGKAVTDADAALRSKAWNNTKVVAHHAIIPTPKLAGGAGMSPSAAKIYDLITRQYLMQFYPPAVFADGKLAFSIAGGVFIAKARRVRELGWRTLLAKDTSDTNGGKALPVLALGQVLRCANGILLSKETEPPRAFTEATLLQAMTGIASYVLDASLKKILRDTDGLGTEATRASILEGLFRRALLTRDKKNIHAAEAGRGLIYALPDSAAFPDMTAHWERQLGDMAEGHATYAPFMTALQTSIDAQMEAAKTCEVPASLRGLKSPPRPPRKQSSRRARNGTAKNTDRNSDKHAKAKAR